MSIFNDFEKITGYSFTNEELLKEALTHSSFSHEMKEGFKRPHNERLEFLGDAVLELVSSDFLYKKFEKVQEGELSKTRASLVCEQTLAACARDIRLGEFLQLGRGERQNGGAERDSILSDAFEAVIGAIYLDGGMEPASKFIVKYLLDDFEKHRAFFDSKTVLQEIVQEKYTLPLRYAIVSESGPDHDKSYTACVLLGDEMVSEGTGKTKKAAEQQAAYIAIKMLNG